MSRKNAAFFKAYGTILAGLVVVIVFSILQPKTFFSVNNLINVSRQISLLVIISLGSTLVVAINEFDLSIGALVSLGGIVGAQLAVAGAPMLLCIFVPILCCSIIGLINGWIVTKFKVLSFITTLAMGTILSGFTFWLAKGSTIFEGIPNAFKILGTADILGIPVLSVIMVILTVLFWFVMRHTTFGRRLYAIGGNVASSVVAGIKVRKHKTLAFALCASLCGFAGMLLSSRLGSAHPTGGDGYNLQSYAAVFLGRTMFREGVPNILGTFIGAAILGVLANGLTIMRVPTFIQNILTGLIIILAVIVQKIGHGDSK